ncbi:MAG: hypothetical protein Kow0090_17400 [Myxococcota bacterium]
MVQFNIAKREIVLKIVYYGPALSGKTTNLLSLHKFMKKDGCGELMTLDTQNDRTLFFDLLPLNIKTTGGTQLKIKLYTVPGQVIHNSTRKLVLVGVDAIAFIADSQLHLAEANGESWKNMIQNLKENNLAPDDVPVVLQFNKRDLANIRTDDQIIALRSRQKEPIYTAVATEGLGVLETFFGLLNIAFDRLNEKHQFTQKFGLTKEEFLMNVYQNVDKKVVPLSMAQLLGAPPIVKPTRKTV